MRPLATSDASTMAETTRSWVSSRLVWVGAIHAPLPPAAANQLKQAVATIAPSIGDHAFVADFDQVKPLSRRGDTGARNGSQRSQTACDPARPTQRVRAGERLPNRLMPTAPDLSELDGMQKVGRSNPLGSTGLRVRAKPRA